MNIELLKIINELNDRLLNLENKTLIEEGI